jgi:hypothetical protein
MDGQEIFFASSSLDNQEGPLGFKFCYLNYQQRKYPLPTNNLYIKIGVYGHSEQAPTTAPWRMNGKRSGNSFLLGSSPLANHGC